MNENLPRERNNICNRIHSYFHFLNEVNLIVFLQYKTTRGIEFEEYLGLPVWHLGLEERTKPLNSSQCYEETRIEKIKPCTEAVGEYRLFTIPRSVS